MAQPSLYQLENSLRGAKSTDELNEILRAYFEKLGITSFAFTYYSYHPNSMHKLKYDYASPTYLLWHKHYISEGYEDIDTTLDQVYQTSLPVFWDLKDQLKNATTPREKKMREDSIAYGVERGFSIPVHGPQEDFAILVITQMKGQTSLADPRFIQYELFSIAYYFYSYLQKLLFKKLTANNTTVLNERELQCLMLLAKQYSTRAIADALNITERTVNFHIQRLNKKLGTKNKYQSVIKALNSGMIKI